MTEESPPKKKRRWLRWLVILFFTGITGCGVFFALLQTPPAKRFLAAQLTALLTSQLPWPVEIEGVGGLLPLVATVDSVRLGETGSPWLELEHAAVKLNALPLLRGQMSIERLRAATVALHRLPASADPEVEEPRSPLVLPAVTDLPSWLRLGRLEIDRVALDESILGEAIAFDVGGSYLPEAAEPLRLNLRGLDSTRATAALHGVLRDGTVQTNLTLEDQTIIPGLGPLTGPLAATLNLDGPLENVKLSLNVSNNEESMLSLDAMLHYGEPLRLDGDAKVAVPEALMPPAALERLGRTFDLQLDVAMSEGTRLAVQDTRVAFAQGMLTLDGTYALADGAMDLSPRLTYQDFHRLTGQVNEGDPIPMEAEVPLQGTLASMVIAPAIRVGGEPFLNGDLTLGLSDTVTVAGKVVLHPAVTTTPAAFRKVLADGAHLDLDAAYAQGLVTIATAHVDVGAATLDLSGTANPEEQLLDLQLQAHAENLAAFADLAGMPLEGATHLKLTARGDASSTLLDGIFQVDRLVARSVQAPEGNLKVTVSAGGFPGDLTRRIEAEIAGSFPRFAPQPDWVRDLTLQGKVAIDELERVQVDALDITDGNLSVKANGAIDLASRAADFDAAIQVVRAGDYAAVFDLPYEGGADATLSIKSGDAPGSLVASLAGAMHDLKGLPAPADGLIGREAAIQADGSYDGEHAILNAFSFSSDGFKAAGSGAYSITENSLKTQISGSLAALAPLGQVAGRPLSGAAEFHVEAKGPLDNFEAHGDLKGTNLHLDTLVSDSADVRFSASGIPASISAEVEAALTQEGATLELRARGAKRDSDITVEALDIAAGENQVSGEGAVDLANRRGRGTLSVEAPKLDDLRTWLKMPLAGSLSLNATLADGTDTLSGDLAATNVVAGTTRLGRAEGTFAVDDVFGAPSGNVTLSAEALEAGEIRVAKLQVNADGPPAALALNVKTEGVYQGFSRFNIDAGGTLTGETGAFELRSLAFGVEDDHFALRSPATLSWKGGAGTLSPLALESASGSIEVGGRYAPDAVDLTASWNDVALRLAELAGIDPMGGTVSGSLHVTGPPDDPVVDATAHVAGYRAELDDTDTPGMDLMLDTKAGEGYLTANLTASVPEAAEFNGQLALPVTLSLAPWAFQVPAGARLAGVVKGQADLERVAPLLPLEGHALRGALAADVTIGGVSKAPLLTGAITVDQGYYENGNTSTILNDLAITVTAEGDTLRLTRFSANDTAGGTVSGEGEVIFHPAEKTPYDFTLRLDHPRLVYRDDMRAEGAGELHLKGNTESASLTGDVTVGPAYLTIPEGSGKTRVTTVDFTEAEGEGEGDEEEEAPSYTLDLDLSIGLPGKIFLSGPGLDSEWEGNFKVTRSAAEPAVEGVLRVKKGTLEFLGRLFNLADSTITFDGQSPPAPFLRIDAVTETEDVVAHVRMEGVTDALNITLVSDPPLPQDEILARVLFGQRLSDVSPVQALTLARYAPIFNKKQSGRSLLGSQGPKPFLVDRVSLRSGTGVGDASITTGKYLNDDFYLEFEQGLGAAQSLVSLEWLFAPRWSLKGKTSSQGQGGLGVFWKKDY